MRWLFITLLPFFLTGCNNEQAENAIENPAREQIWFVNTKWKDTLFIGLLKDTLQQTTGYLLGGDTFLVDSTNKLSEKFKGVKSTPIQHFIKLFTDEHASKRIHPSPLNYAEIDQLMCDDVLNDTNVQWYVFDSALVPSPLWVYEQNLDNKRPFETIIEIDRSHAWKHEYRIYEPDSERNKKCIGIIEAVNRGFGKTGLITFDKRYFFGVPEFGWGTGYNAQFITLHKVLMKNVYVVSQKIPLLMEKTYYQFADEFTGASTTLTASIVDEKEEQVQIIYEYTLNVHGYSCENPVIDKAAYGVMYKFNKSEYMYVPQDPNKHTNLALRTEQFELTPLFAEQIERVRQKGTRNQQLALRNFRRENWKFPSDTLY